MEGLPGLIQNLGDDKETVGIVRGIGQLGCLGQTFLHHILPDHIKDGNGVRCRLDARDIEFVHLLDMVENASELPTEKLDLLRCDLESRQTGEIRDINRVMGDAS